LSLKKFNLLEDIYYSNEYISLYIKEDEELFSFEYKEDNKIFVNKTIKRPIKKIGNEDVNDGYYDLETAYGYGGFYTNSGDKEFLEKAFNSYKLKCNEERIIAEFIRFHPFNDFPVYSELLEFNLQDRDIVVVNLTTNLLSNYSKKTRYIIRQATKNIECGISYELDTFFNIYQLTMLKNKADEFYFFSKEFFLRLLDNESVSLYAATLDGKIVSMALFIFGEDFAHYHLSANTEESYKYGANYALLQYVFEQAQKKEKKYVILGGGTTSNDEDSLLKFKKKFSKETRPFYISGKIYNQKMYEKYNKVWLGQSGKDIKYFLKYRLEIE
jgi:hypothetical protein